MKTKIVLSVLLVNLALGGYIPIPAPIPMGNYSMYAGQTWTGTFDIIDPNGPVGLTISCSPAGLVISEPNIVTVDGYPEARKYIYPYKYTATLNGTKEFTITSTDTLGVVVEQKIVFNVKGNAPHVFTGCRGGVGETSKWTEYDAQWQYLSPKVTGGNTYVMQMRGNGTGVETNIYKQE